MPRGFGKSRASLKVWFWRVLRFFHTRTREVRAIMRALVSTTHPFLVHIIPIRRCNLACTYCNEFDDFSHPVVLEEMKGRLDILADMGTSIITISGGEPLLHPELDEIIRHIRRRGLIAHRAVDLGLTSTVGIIHDHNGQLKPLGPREIEIFEEIMTLSKRSFSRFNDFQHNVARGKEHNWRCRSGSRYLYVCEDGLVHWCSQQR